MTEPREYKNLTVVTEHDGPCVIILSRWDGLRARVFPSQRHHDTREAIVFNTPAEAMSELTKVDELVQDEYRVDLVRPEVAQAFVNELTDKIEASRQTVPIKPRGFSLVELDKMKLEREEVL